MSWEAGLEDGSHTIGRWLTDRARAVAAPDRDRRPRRHDRLRHPRRVARTELAEGLRAGGYGPGDRIATVSGNSSDHVVAFFACALAGIAFVPLSWRITPRELADVLRRSDPALVLIDDEYGSLAGEALRGLDVVPPIAALGSTGVEASVPARSRTRSPCVTCATTTRCW